MSEMPVQIGEPKQYHEGGVLPIFKVDLEEKKGSYAMRTLSMNIASNKLQSDKFGNRTLLFLTECNIMHAFYEGCTQDYVKVLKEIREGSFNAISNKPFRFYDVNSLSKIFGLETFSVETSNPYISAYTLPQSPKNHSIRAVTDEVIIGLRKLKMNSRSLDSLERDVHLWYDNFRSQRELK